MPKKMNVLGLMVVPEIPETDVWAFSVVVARDSPANPYFFSNPYLREKLENLGFSVGHRIGNFTYRFTTPVRRITEDIHPFETKEYGRTPFIGRRIATELEKRVLLIIEKGLGPKPFIFRNKVSGSVGVIRNRQLEILKNGFGGNLIIKDFAIAGKHRIRQLKNRELTQYFEGDEVFGNYTIPLQKMRNGINRAIRKMKKNYRHAQEEPYRSIPKKRFMPR